MWSGAMVVAWKREALLLSPAAAPKAAAPKAAAPKGGAKGRGRRRFGCDTGAHSLVIRE